MVKKTEERQQLAVQQKNVQSVKFTKSSQFFSNLQEGTKERQGKEKKVKQ